MFFRPIRSDVLVFRGNDVARWEPREKLVSYPRCSEGEFLTVRSGELKCVGPSNIPYGIQGLLPVCNEGKILQSEGFGKWRCIDMPAEKK